MKLGAERKKIYILGGLLVVAAVMFWLNRSDDGATPQSGRAVPAVTPGPAPVATRNSTPAPAPANISQAPRNRTGTRSSQEFKPSLKPRRPEDRADPMTVDPTLRLDLLAKVRDVRLQGGTRSLFEFSQAPPPKTADVKIVPKAIKNALNTPPSATPEAPAAPVKPPPPPIQLKFYGYVNQTQKRAFFIEGEEIFVVSEGELIKKRYKIIRIGLTSAVVEDTQFQHQQTLPLEEQPA
jgi:hypothetical protein